MGFHREPQPAALDRAALHELIAAELQPDPYGIDDPCPTNAGGPHNFKPDCGDIVCLQCGQVAP